MQHQLQPRVITAALCAALILELPVPGALARAQTQTAAPVQETPNFARLWTRFFATLPSQAGRLEEIFDPKGAIDASGAHGAWSGRAILMIEDDPSDPDVQKRIAALISSLVAKTGVTLIGVEGAEGDASMNFIKKLGSSARRNEAARDMAERSRLSGAEWAHLTLKTNTVLWGTDNPELFSRAAELYLRSMGAREHAGQHLRQMSLAMALFLKKDELLSSELRPRIRQSLLSISRVTRVLGSEPGELGREEYRECALHYRAAAQNINDAVRELALGETGVFFADPVFEQLEAMDADFVRAERQRDVEAARRAVEAMDANGVRSAVWVLRPRRMDTAVQEIRKLGVAYLRVLPGSGTAASAAGHAYNKELAESFGSEEEGLYIGRPANPIRLLPLMAQLPLDIERGREPRIRELADLMGPEAHARVGNLVDAFIGAARTGSAPVTRSRAAVRPGNAQGMIESVPLPPQASLPDTSPRDTWLMSAAAESLERYEAFREHLSGMKVRSPDRRVREPKKPLTPEVIRSAAEGYAARLNAIAARMEASRVIVIRSIGTAVTSAGSVFASSSIGPSWSLCWGHLARREGLLTAAGRFGWIKPRTDDRAILERPKTDRGTLMKFLRSTLMRSGIPKSYRLPKGYWEIHRGQTDSKGEVDRIIERQIAENSLSIYDGAVWQIALALEQPREAAGEVRGLTRVLSDGHLGDLETIRAHLFPYRYGDRHLPLPKSAAFFFRMITDRYTQPDPMDGSRRRENFPNHPTLHHEDWKPVMGEQAWAAVLGPLHAEGLLTAAGVPRSALAEDLAEGLLPAFESMMSPIGAVYHVPHGTHGKSGYEISTENNLSLLAAMRILRAQLTARGRTEAAERAAWIMNGLQSYFRKHAYDREAGVFIQGGHYLNGKFVPANVFATDCQTWGIAALGPDWIDKEFGEGAAREIWKTTRRRSGTFGAWGDLEGVGFTDQEQVVSVEWTAGAILACRMMAEHYREARPEWAAELESDAARMRLAMDRYRVSLEDGSEAYLYSNRRFFIPFGWWANPVPSLVSTAWIVLLDRDFNPFWPEGKYVPVRARPAAQMI